MMAVDTNRMERMEPLQFEDGSRRRQQQQQTSGLTVGPGVAAGVVGLLLGGPFLAFALGFGAEYAANQARTAPATRDMTRRPDNDDDDLQTRPGRSRTEEEKESSRVTLAAGVAAGVVGLCCCGGPFMACLMGFGAAYATGKGGATGDVARAVGKVAITAQQHAQEVNAKHRLVEKTRDACHRAVQHAQELDRQHGIVDQTKDFVRYSWNQTVRANREHRIVERTVHAVGTGISFVATKAWEAIQHEPRTTVITNHHHNHNEVYHPPPPTAPVEPRVNLYQAITD